MSSHELVSIVINNYNYARYLSDSIESALAQTWTATEVIVVDDGSTDNSREVIARYGGRITEVLKENGGQASALNAGFERARGNIILFLDADDVLNQTTVAKVVEAFRRNPSAAKVQWRLELMDAQGKRIPAFTPPLHVALPNGYLVPRLLRFPDDIPFPPTSGNAYSAMVLGKTLPMPEQEFRLCADYYLLNLAPLFGPIVSLEEIGGRYRVHGENQHYGSVLNLEQVRQIIARTQSAHLHLHRVGGLLGYWDASKKPVEDGSVTFLAHRLVSYKFARQKHPVAGDNLLSLTIGGIRSAVEGPELPTLRRLMWALWFPLVAVTPGPLSRRLASLFYQGAGQANGSRRQTPVS